MPGNPSVNHKEVLEKGKIEDEMVGWHHQFSRHELGQTSGDAEGQRSLACHSPWGHKKSDMTWQLNNNFIHEILQ